MEQPSFSARSVRWEWILLVAVVVLAFGTLLYFGRQIYQLAPPIPERVVDSTGTVLFSRADILEGQDVWRSIGGHELGSVWGHGSYTAPDWTADWIHREALHGLNRMAQELAGTSYAGVSPEGQAALQVRLQREVRANTFDPATGDVTVSSARAESIRAVQAHYVDLFGDAPALAELRDAYAMPPNTVSTLDRRRALTAFLFWASWACMTQRPDDTITYTNNWPPEPLIANRPTGAMLVVSIASFVLLLGGIGALVWFYAATRDKWKNEPSSAAGDPLFGLEPTPSMRATLKFFWVVAALILVQMAVGVITAHYGVEGDGFYGIPLSKWIPYSLSRTWHLQLAIFWIATSWLATGLCLAPAVAGREPAFQRFGVNLLFAALIVVVGGSMIGEALAIHQKLDNGINFLFGHQGYEYVELGRIWQIALFVGLLLWLALMLRGLWPALHASRGEDRQLVVVFILSAVAIALFYGAGLGWGRHSNLAIAEYWRWWVVHLWVEGFFEVFAVAAIAFVFSRLGLIRIRSALMAVLFAAILYLSGGVLGLFHHLYFTGTTPIIMVLGGVFSALELMPLILVGYEGYDNWRLARSTPWIQHYKWPIYWFVAVAFWNLVGAGLFGFLINPPIALYYVQGLHLTPLHGHAALFGVYGMFGIGLTLLSLRLLQENRVWKEGALQFAFWGTNIGLALMLLLSLLPVGLIQAWASVEHGIWYARSAEFMQIPLLQMLRWMRMVGDTVFALGILALVWFIAGLSTGWSVHGVRRDARAAAGPA